MNWRRWLFCWRPWPFYGHRYEVIETYDSVTRKLKCVDCERYFAMSDRHRAVLPWDADFESIVRMTYGVPRSKL